MLNLKEKYIKISSLFSVILFQSYINSLTITDKDELELFNYIKGIQKVNPEKYFDDLFDYVEKSPKKVHYKLFLEEAFLKILNLAREQLETVAHELQKLIEFEGIPEMSMGNKYDNLLRGYFYTIEDLDAMIDYFTVTEEFEKCDRIIKIKKKYYSV